MKRADPNLHPGLQKSRDSQLISKTRSVSKLIQEGDGPTSQQAEFLREKEKLRRRLAAAEAELRFYKSKHEWLQSALDTQRHARQLLEASVAASYRATIARIREVVSSVTPKQARLVVISKGDPELVQFDDRPAWHFPQSQDGGYAGFYPADSSAAISELKALIAKGGEFLLLPNTAFWWLEHYRQLGEWLDNSHKQVWRDERCVVYKFLKENSPRNDVERSAKPDRPKANGSPAQAAVAKTARNSNPPMKLPAQPSASDLVCFPIIDWDFRFQRPQQLMRRFAAAGHRVFYLSHQFHKSGKSYSLRPLGTSLWEVSLQGPRYHTYQGVLDDGHRDTLFASLTELRWARRLNHVVAVVQSPFWWPLVKEAAETFGWTIVYDCMDFHAGFSGSNPLLIEQERQLLAAAELVVASSPRLQEYACQYSRRVLLLRNGCDYEHFAKARRQTKGNRPVIGYYGAIADWFDSDLVADLAERHPNWDFLLVGSTFSADVRRLSRLKNVALPGEKPYAEIPVCLANFDVAILPFKRTPLTEAANPVKAYEILASGKPLVSVPLPEVARLTPLVRLASTVSEFEREIQAALSETSSDCEPKRRAFARRNTWDQRFEQLATALAGARIKPKGNRLTRHRSSPLSAQFL